MKRIGRHADMAQENVDYTAARRPGVDIGIHHEIRGGGSVEFEELSADFLSSLRN